MHPSRIVLTGGPGAGKTVISREIVSRHPAVFALVPEAASQVYQQLRKRWDQLDAAGQRDVQRRIYGLQIEQEQRLAALHPDKVLLLDRGTVDGAAYWPEGPDNYWKALHTTPQRELDRYHDVFWMQSSAAIGLYDGPASNQCRSEDASAAIACGQAVASLWQPHPRFHLVGACPDVNQKITAVERQLLSLLNG